jgi:dolichyl-phosphate-mannose--protein O-mannosyl transferase
MIEKKKIINYLLLIILLSFTVRTVKVLTNPIVCRDSILYIKMADTWAELGAKEALVGYIPPAYVFILAMGQKYLDLRPETVGNIVGVILGSLIPLAVFWIAFSLFDCYKLALIAALLAAIQPYLIRTSTLILRDAVYVPMLSCAFAFAASAIKSKSILNWCLFAVFIAIAAMSRYEGLFVVPIFFIWALYELFTSKQSLLKRFRYLALSSCMVIFIYFGLTYMVKISLSEATYSLWSSTDISSLEPPVVMRAK